MSKVVKEFTSLTPLKAPVPPMLATAMGYTGEARFVAFHWQRQVDEVEFFDGRRRATAHWYPFFVYIQHPAVRPHLRGYDVGISSDREATHALILDRESLELFIAAVNVAEAFLTKQRRSWPPSRMNREEYLAKISEALQQVEQSDEAMNRQIQEHSALIEEMRRWLDRYLKN
jgi:hypothetical protein